jgi:hypothetical protein
MPVALEDILGTWRLLSYVREVISTGERYNQFGDHPYGYLGYAPDGRMYGIFTDRAPEGVAATAEAEASGTVVAYAGTYQLDGDRMVHHVDIAWNPAWTGTDQVRFLDLKDGVLTITTAPYRSYVDGREGRSILTWTKLSAG